VLENIRTARMVEVDVAMSAYLAQVLRVRFSPLPPTRIGRCGNQEMVGPPEAVPTSVLDSADGGEGIVPSTEIVG